MANRTRDKLAPDMAAEISAEIAAEVAARALQTHVTQVEEIAGKGEVNRIFVVQTPAGKSVVRLNADPQAQRDYVKEQWCLDQAAAQGVPGPQVLARGVWRDIAYVLQSYVEGTHGEAYAAPAHIWERLGDSTRRIHAIPVLGFGEQLADGNVGRFVSPPHRGFDGSWASFVQYNRDSLTETDALLRLSVITWAEAQHFRARFAALLARRFDFGLCHGDLSLKNTLVDEAGTVYLLDWGSAEVHLMPHWSLVQLLGDQVRDGADPATLPAMLPAFLRGYGLSEDSYLALQPELGTLLVLQAFDKLRWALDRHPPRVAPYAAHAKAAVQWQLQVGESHS